MNKINRPNPDPQPPWSEESNYMWVFHIKIRFDTENFLHCEFDPCSPGVATTEPGDMVNQYTLRTNKKRVKFLMKFF